MAKKRTCLVFVGESDIIGSAAVAALKGLREYEVNYITGSSLKDFRDDTLKKAEIVIWVMNSDSNEFSQLLQKCKAVRWIHSWSAGFDGVRTVFQNYYNISTNELHFSNGRTAFSKDLAEWTAGVCLFFSKQIPRLLKNSAEKKWDQFVMSTLRHKTVGFIGYGDIAAEIAKLLTESFSMICMAVRRSKTEAVYPLQFVCSSDDVEDRLKVFRESDFVISTLPGTPETVHSIGSTEFKEMKKTAIFISIGRGVVVDEKSLCDALDNFEIAGAALDVFEQEPLSADSPLWNRLNVLISPHNADFTLNHAFNACSVFEKNLNKYLETGDLVTEVNVFRGY